MNEKKYAVVTGSTKGIGKAIATKLLIEGYFVFVNYAQDEEAAAEFLKEMSGFKNQIHMIKCELASSESVSRFAIEVLKITKTIDCLVLNVGATDRTTFFSIDSKKWNYVMDVCLNAPFFLIQKLGMSLRPNRGNIIFIGSILGEYPHAFSLAYSVSKAAVHQMAKCLVKEFAPMGITVNAIAPGFVETPWQAQKSDDIKESIKSKIALHRFAEPEEVAELCWHVINNRYINGSILEISGGYCYK
ncbi:SDR family NAD(P)-dependent oxidoreductase [Harryflintia acetispora]|uniref:SDR family NAD(P)-dependent oxidoreductase n=1 Tax=Harryflintia acetispora TaxID=1849041 RepID=UPI001897B05B|nr:SDR family oxidoreductase [Harryflintia acetispora]